MRIAMISEHASPLGAGGQHSYVADLSVALAEIGHDVRVYTRREDPAVAETVTTPAGTTAVPGYSVAFIPAGDSEIRISGTGKIVRMFTTRAEDLCARCANAAAYQTAHPNVAPFRPWPEASSEPKVRAYSLDVPDEPGRATSPSCHRITTTISSRSRSRSRAASPITCAGRGPPT